MDRHSATRRLQHLAASASSAIQRLHPHLLRHTYVATRLDAGVDLSTPGSPPGTPTRRTTMHYDRARKNLDRYANYNLAANMAPAHHTAARP